MHWVLIVWLVIIAIVVFFNWANHRTKIQHAAFTKSDVIAAIENVVWGYDDHDEWDLFLAWPIGDPYLESVRQRCLAISSEYSGIEQGKDIATKGETILLEILDEIESRA
jgi:hypothetical protein